MNNIKICQTLWTGHKDLLEDSFGWFSPEHHIMAWTYSCLKLREFYSDVRLYTDTHGANILINTLDLPYSTYHVEYDNLKYNPSLWALPKILTYKKQLAPFIHVDGDVFIFEKFNEKLEKADLVAQNLEVSTDYYKNLFSPIIKKITYAPDFFEDNLFSKYPKSYNAGILGGSDIELLQRYVWEAIKFIDLNHSCQSNGNLNMIFEQLMFYSIAKTHNAEAQCYFDKIYNDNGYDSNVFGDFLSIPKVKYLHLIGALKRNEFIVNQLSRRLFKEYPEYFEKVISLFKQSSHIYFLHQKKRGVQNNNKKAKGKMNFYRTKALINRLYPENIVKSDQSVVLFVKAKNNRVLNEVYNYEKKLHYLRARKFSRIDRNDVLNIEKKVVESNKSLIDIQSNISSSKILLNPYIEIINTAFDVIDFNPYNILRDEENQRTVACVPQLFFEGYRAANLDAVSINIVSILYEESTPITFRELEKKMSVLFDRVDNDERAIRSLIITNLKFLVGNNFVYLENK